MPEDVDELTEDFSESTSKSSAAAADNSSNSDLLSSPVRERKKFTSSSNSSKKFGGSVRSSSRKSTNSQFQRSPAASTSDRTRRVSSARKKPISGTGGAATFKNEPPLEKAPESTATNTRGTRISGTDLLESIGNDSNAELTFYGADSTRSSEINRSYQLPSSPESSTRSSNKTSKRSLIVGNGKDDDVHRNKKNEESSSTEQQKTNEMSPWSRDIRKKMDEKEEEGLRKEELNLVVAGVTLLDDDDADNPTVTANGGNEEPQKNKNNKSHYNNNPFEEDDEDKKRAVEKQGKSNNPFEDVRMKSKPPNSNNPFGTDSYDDDDNNNNHEESNNGGSMPMVSMVPSEDVTNINKSKTHQKKKAAAGRNNSNNKIATVPSQDVSERSGKSLNTVPSEEAVAPDDLNKHDIRPYRPYYQTNDQAENGMGGVATSSSSSNEQTDAAAEESPMIIDDNETSNITSNNAVMERVTDKAIFRDMPSIQEQQLDDGDGVKPSSHHAADDDDNNNRGDDGVIMDDDHAKILEASLTRSRELMSNSTDSSGGMMANNNTASGSNHHDLSSRPLRTTNTTESHNKEDNDERDRQDDNDDDKKPAVMVSSRKEASRVPNTRKLDSDKEDEEEEWSMNSAEPVDTYWDGRDRRSENVNDGNEYKKSYRKKLLAAKSARMAGSGSTVSSTNSEDGVGGAVSLARSTDQSDWGSVVSHGSAPTYKSYKSKQRRELYGGLMYHDSSESAAVISMVESKRQCWFQHEIEVSQREWKRYKKWFRGGAKEIARVEQLTRCSYDALTVYSDTLDAICADTFVNDEGELLTKREKTRLEKKRLDTSGDSLETGTAEHPILDPLVDAYRQLKIVFDDNLSPLEQIVKDAVDLREEFRSQAKELEEQGDAIGLDSLERAEQNIRDAFDTFMNVVDRYENAELQTDGILEPSEEEVVPDRWMCETSYRNAANLGLLMWREYRLRCQKLYEKIVELDNTRRSRLKEILLSFLPKRKKMMESAQRALSSGSAELKASKNSLRAEKKEIEACLQDLNDSLDPSSEHSGRWTNVSPKGREGDFDSSALGALWESRYIREVRTIEAKFGKVWKPALCVITLDDYLHICVTPDADDNENTALHPIPEFSIKLADFDINVNENEVELVRKNRSKIFRKRDDRLLLKLDSEEEASNWVENLRQALSGVVIDDTTAEF